MADNNSPWGNSPNEDKKPSAPNRQKETPPDIEELFRKSQDKVRYIMNSGGGDKKNLTSKGGFLICLALVLLWLLTGFYQVQPQEQGVVLRFGKYAYTTAPGLHYHLPYPIETVYKPNVSRENRLEIGFRSTPQRSRYAPSNELDVSAENIALTGDENIVEVNFTVTWKVKNAGDFLFNVRNPEATVRTATESAMRDAIGVTPIMEIIADDRKGVQEKAEKTLQALLDKYKTGITVTSVQLTKADAPAQVIDAFNDVQRAKADKERLSNEAEAYRNDILPRARGQAARLQSEAEAYTSQVIDTAKGDTSRYLAVLEEYLKAKEVVAQRLYLETMEEVYKGVDKVIVDKAVGSGVVPYLPLSEVKKN